MTVPPLSITETMQLKLASAIIAKPRVLVLSQIFDVMPERCMRDSMARLQREGDMTVIYFSNRHCDLHFDHFLYLGEQRQELLDSYEKLCELAGLPRQSLYPVEVA